MKKKLYVFIALVVLVCSLTMVASATPEEAEACPRCSATSTIPKDTDPAYAQHSSTKHAITVTRKHTCTYCNLVVRTENVILALESHTWIANGDIHNYGVNQTHTFYTLCKWCNEPSTLVTSCTNPCNGGGGGILSIDEPDLQD